MEFRSRNDIEAPQEYVFGAASDFSVFERQALRRGLDVVRTSGEGPVDVGSTWKLKVNFQNRSWTIDASVISFDPTSGYVVRGVTDGVDIDFTVDLMALSRTTTRMTVLVKFLPRSLSTRLMVKSKVETRVASFASDIEDKYRAVS